MYNTTGSIKLYFIYQYQVKEILFLIVPNFSIEISTISLCLRYFGSFIDIATPAGVPVDIISPGSNVMRLLKEDIIFRIGITILLLEEFCLISPFTIVFIFKD